MDQDLREAFATLSAQIATVGEDAREASTRSRETQAVVGRLRVDVDNLKHAVFGSNPPPAPPPLPLTARITEGEGSHAELVGVVLNLQGEVRAVKEQNTEQLAMLNTITTAVTGVTKHPLARKVAWTAGIAFLAWLTAVSARFEAKLHDAPVYQPDGGAK